MQDYSIVEGWELCFEFERQIEEGNMWIADGKIMDAEKAFYSKVNCSTLIPDEVCFGGRSYYIDY